jgi:Subtilisin inhibitor-like
VSVTYPLIAVYYPHATCPTGGTCSTIPLRLPKGATTNLVRFRLTCNPAGGTYPDPVLACAALENLMHQEDVWAHQSTHVVCSCPFPFVPAGRVIGLVDGRHVNVEITGCEGVCGSPSALRSDAAVLTPAT